ncbi:class A beta-lactamase-related serine hydrolase [Nocardioides immobilis]|uniref:Class A beta-lactamase-related serine hydrolase n=1 Tax=Nocardioides immobilis TaxID=2049295 RepID=A0A417Y6N7_9ACTN|nr:serine hydrolase domain-containing protein [Nocardioides immobilis]RHW28350.1 class A beta-lactamase-related serine hydrolase [Nocardioides immobilis]
MSAPQATSGARGDCAPGFAGVREEFERNFEERGEIGASVAVFLDGEPVVDLWGGVADPDTGRPWEADTLSVLQSVTKGAVSLCANVLVARGELDLDAPVATYWPEFAQAGKETIPVRWVLSHLDGVPVIRRPQKADALLHWDEVVADLAAEEPLWEPGTRSGYHGFAYGYLVGEIVRRVTGRSIGRFFREEVAEPLGLDFWIGLPLEHHARVAPAIAGPPDLDHPVHQLMMEPGSLQNMLVLNGGAYFGAGLADSPEAYSAEMASTGGIGNARSIAGMYAPLALGGAFRGVRLMGPGDVARLAFPQAAGVDAMLLVPMTYTLGFWRSMDNRRSRVTGTDSMVLSTEAFGHPGFGGRLGFADPGARISFGYTNNKMSSRTTVGNRGQALVDAVYRALGYEGGETGHWVRPA